LTATDVQPAGLGHDQARVTSWVRGVVPGQSDSLGRVQEVLRTLPSHGWTAGWTGRADRALLVLSQLAGLSYANIAALTAGDLTIADGTATIRTPGGKTTLRGIDNDLLCGPCALARWVHALDLTMVYPDGRVTAAVIARAVPLTPHSPQLCDGTTVITETTRQVLLLPPTEGGGTPPGRRSRPNRPGRHREIPATSSQSNTPHTTPRRPPTAHRCAQTRCRTGSSSCSTAQHDKPRRRGSGLLTSRANSRKTATASWTPRGSNVLERCTGRTGQPWWPANVQHIPGVLSLRPKWHPGLDMARV